jgi:hypothetical protein
MSKMDALRAMREAKYAANAKRSATAPPRSASTAKAAVAPAAPKAAASAAAPVADEAACGHRNMSGRTCTREAGHAAKTHRYS